MLHDKVVKKCYILYNLHTNKDDVGAKIKSGSKFYENDKIEEHNLDHDVTNDEYSWLTKLQQNNNVGEIDHRMGSNEVKTHSFGLRMKLFEMVLQADNQML